MDRIRQLEKENLWLREEVKRLRFQLSMIKENEWAHPDSCVHNSDPWVTWKSHN